MYIPHGTGQVSHNFIIDDTTRPFADFTDIYLRFINQDKIVHAYEMNKRNNLELWTLRREIDLEKEKLNGIIVKKEIHEIIETNNYNLDDLLTNRQFDVLNQIFDRYYSIQLNQNCKRYYLEIDIDEDIQRVAILNKIEQGHYYAADTILSIIEKNRQLNDYYKHIKKICEYCRKLSIAIYDDKDINAVKNLLNDIPEDYENLVDIFRATLWLKLKTAQNDEDIESIIKQGTDMLKYYPNDGELMSYVAEAYFNLGNIEKATEFYDIAVNNTRNGFVWRNAKEKVGIDRMAGEEIHVN